MNSITDLQISEDVQASVAEYLQSHPDAKKIAELEQKIRHKQNEIIDLEAELSKLQKWRPEINLEYRKSIIWCLTIDAGNPYYFLKSKEGLVKCVEFKHKIKLTAKQNNSFGGILSGMYKDGLVGRIMHLDMYFYGLPELFERGGDGRYSKLKKKCEKDVPLLRQVNV